MQVRGGNFFSKEDSLAFKKAVYEGFNCIYNFQFSKADSIVTKLKASHPNETEVYILASNSFWWKLRSGEDNKTNRKKFSDNLSAAKSILDKKDKTKLSNEDVFNYINIFSYFARLEILDDNYLKALSYMDKCIHHLENSFNKESAYESFKLTSGLYHYVISVAKKKYSFIFPYLLFLPKADKEKGISFLKQCTESKDVLLTTEGNYFLMIIYAEGENDSGLSEKNASTLCEKQTGNLLYQYYYFKVLIQQDKKNEALKQLENLQVKISKNKELTGKQKSFFVDSAKKDFEEYYKRQSSRK